MANAPTVPPPVNPANPFVKPTVTPAPNFDAKGALTAVGNSIAGGLAAAGQRAAAPVSSSPFASPPVDAGPPVAPKAQPLLAPGTSAFGAPVPITFGTVPGLTANFTTPPKTTSAAPAVVTADAANDHIDKVTTAANTANTDMQNAAATKAQLAAQYSPGSYDSAQKANAANAALPQASYDAKGNLVMSTGGSPSAGQLVMTPQGPTVYGGSNDSTALDSLFASLGGDTSGGTGDTSADQQAVSDTQQATGDELAAENVTDTQTLATISDALTSMENGTMPLTPSEQAQVDSLKTSLSGALNDAQTYAQSVQAGATAADAGGENGGLSEYSPQMSVANIASAIKTGSDKIAAVNNQIVTAQSKLTASLQAGDYKTASRLYSQISAGITSRNNEIDKINTSVQNHIDKMQTNALDVAKLEISTLTSKATQDATAAYRAQQLILSNARLTETERKDAMTALNSANGKRTAADATTQVLGQFAAAFVPGAKMADGTPTVDENGYITPAAWKAAIADAPKEAAAINGSVTRADFIKQFGNQIYSDPKTGIDARAYGLTPAEVKLINGALPAAGS